MGLKCTHDAFFGSYSAFNRFRQCIAEATGGSFPDHYVYGPGGEWVLEDPSKPNSRPCMKAGLEPENWYTGDDYPLASYPGLVAFLSHSDDSGEISPEMCVKVADDLEELIPAIEALGWKGAGHIERDGGYVAVTKQFIQGCRAAAEAGEPILFL